MHLMRLAAATFVGWALLSLTLISVNIQPGLSKSADEAASFSTLALSQTKIYDGENLSLIFSVKNPNASETLFYVRVLKHERIVFDGKSSPFECTKGEDPKQMTAGLGTWTGPETYTLTIELHSSPSDTLHDSKQLLLTVVKLTAGEVVSSPSKIVWGLNDALPLKVNFTNTGNDDMRDAVVTVMSSDLRISPLSSGNLGNIASGETKSPSFTLSSLNKKDTKPGLYRINLRLSFNDFRGTAHHQDQVLDFNIERMKTRVLLSYSPSNPKYGDIIKFRVELSDETGKKLAGEFVTFDVGSTTTRNETAQSGIAAYTYPAGFDAGNQSLRVSYSGSEYYTDASENFNVRIEPLATVLFVEPAKVLNATIPAPFNVTLLDERSKPVTNQSLKCAVVAQSANFFQTAETDSQGKANFVLNLNSSGNAQISISFAGSRNYLTGTNSTSVRIDPASTRLTLKVNPSIVLSGNTVDLEILLRDRLNRPVWNATTRVLSDKKAVGSFTTDPRGFAQARFSLDPALVYKTTKAQVSFGGDQRFAPSIAEIEVVSINPTALLILIATVLGGAASLLVFVVRSKRTEKKDIQPSATEPVLRPQKLEPYSAEKLSPIDEELYDYIVKNSGIISWSKASQDLGYTVEQLKASAERLRKSGRLTPD